MAKNSVFATPGTLLQEENVLCFEHLDTFNFVSNSKKGYIQNNVNVFKYILLKSHLEQQQNTHKHTTMQEETVHAE